MYKICILISLIATVTISLADDNSTYVDVDTSRYSATDININGAHGGFSVNGDTLHYWNPGNGYNKTNINTGLTTTIGLPSGGINSNGYGDAFGCYDNNNGKFYAATIDNMSDAYIYEYDSNTSEWTEGASSVNAYGADTYNGELYFSGLNEPWNGSTGQNNFVCRYVANTNKTYGTGSLGLHDSLIETAGNSASVTVDNAGNIYYATYNSGSSALYKWGVDLVSNVVDDIVNDEIDEFLTIDDATKLCGLDGGANGITVDDAGNVFVTVNGGTSGSEVVMWNESMGIGDDLSYEVIASLDTTQAWGWFGDLDIDGNFLEGDSLYGAFGWQNPITEITMVPEPLTIALLGLGGLFVRKSKRW